MFKPKMIRLLIYLVISIGLIVLLLNTPIGKSEKKIKEPRNSIDAPEPHGIPIYPSSPAELLNKLNVKVYIDSNENYFIDSVKITKDLVESNLKQKFRFIDSLKRGVILHVEKKTPSQNIVFILDLANKNQWKVGIATKN